LDKNRQEQPDYLDSIRQKKPKEILKQAKEQVREARNISRITDPDCHPYTLQALAEFTVIALKLWKSHRNPLICYNKFVGRRKNMPLLDNMSNSSYTI
jgi:hypothetical protein